MEIKIISSKLLVFSIIIAVVFILFKTLLQRPNHLLQLTTCNEQDRLDIHIRYRGNDFLLNPSSLKNVSYCISKSMPFYDRTIEYVIDPGSTFHNGIVDRYKVGTVITNNKIKIGEYVLDLGSNRVVITANNQRIIIYKRQVNSLFELYSNGPASILSIIRPQSSENSEQLLKKFPVSQQVVKNGEYSINKY